jgi:hypothetical protein
VPASTADDSANTYLRTLYRAGYLQLLEASRPLGVGKGKTLNRYRLLPGKYSGPRPPMISAASTCTTPTWPSGLARGHPP